MTQEIHAGPLRVLCDDPYEVWRAQTFYEKEPGTIAWLDTFQPGDVFYDVGANIGLYAMYAALKVGPTGHVYAFEPHIVNAAHLIRNVKHNGLAKQITVINAALSHSEGWANFYYRSGRAGSSGSQLGHAFGEDGREFTPCLSELKATVTADHLALIVDEIRRPTSIKIDVDGNEYYILTGMAGVLSHVRSVQVEVQPSHRGSIAGFACACGLTESSHHFTSNGRDAIAAGADPSTVVCNTIFEKVATMEHA